MAGAFQIGAAPADGRRWLEERLRDLAPGARRAAAIFATADAFAAVTFALALSQGLARMQDGWPRLAPWLVLLCLAMAARGLLARTATRDFAVRARAVMSIIRREVVRAELFARPADRSPVGVSLARLVEGVEALGGYVLRFTPARMAAVVQPTIVILAMAFASPISAAIGLIAFLPLILALALAGGAAAREATRQFEALGRLSGLFADRVRALPAILAFQAEARVEADLAAGSRELARRILRVLRIGLLSSAALEFFAALSVALIAVYCGFNLLRLAPAADFERLDLPRAVFALALAPELYAPLRRLSAAYHDRRMAEAAANELAGPTAPARASTGSRQSSPPTAPAIRLTDVTVTHAGQSRATLSGFGLAVSAGEVVALVGPTGSGKTTILNLLLGLASASDGRIEVDGQPLDPERGLAARAAWVGQAPVVIPGSLFENIAIGRRQAARTEVERAAARAGFRLAAGGLERRIDERGGGLSGGELRRLALARAFLRDAPLLLLDEPTAHLDSGSEREIASVIAEAARGRTTLIATHSDVVATLADRVVRLAG